MATPNHNSFRPCLEALESRLVPTVSFHHGTVLPNVQAENLYLGSLWQSASGQAVVHKLEGFTSMLVGGTYMDVLNRAGYQVGRGTAWTGDTLNYNLHGQVTDAQIEWAVQQAIHGGMTIQPVRDNLYVVFVEPGVNVLNGRFSSGHGDFTGYHSSFVGTDFFGNARTIHYAVIAYPGDGVNPTAAYYGYPDALADVTDTASHEIGEAVTDPVHMSGWYDNRYGASGEIGDLTNGYHQYLNGYYVQLLAGQNDAPLFLHNGVFFYNGQTYLVSGVPFDAKPAATGPVMELTAAAVDAVFSSPGHETYGVPATRRG